MQAVKLHFYDSANPDNVPSGVHAGVYINGFKWDTEDVRRMKSIFSISVEREADQARLARCIDVENGAALVEDVVPFLKERRRLGFDDGTTYVNRSNWRAVIGTCLEAHIRLPYFWVATLDGTKDLPPEVVDEVSVEAWAVQYFGGPDTAFDLSVLHGVNNFHRP